MSVSPKLDGRSYLKRARIFGALLFALACLLSPMLRAEDTIYDFLNVTGGVNVSVSGTVISASTFPESGFPISLAVTATASLPTYYLLEASVGGDGANVYQSGMSTPALIEFINTAGGIDGTSVAQIDFSNAPGAYLDQISNGALRLVGGPAFYNTSSGSNQWIGGDVNWTHSGTITVAGSGALLDSGPLHAESGWVTSGSLNPAGFRTAQLSGIVAFSYGDQDTNHSHTWPGGNVTLASSGLIAMSNANSSQITAGISAGTASGPATDNPDFPDPVSLPPTVTVVLDSGTITNSADAGLGIMATATGAQFLHGHDGEDDTAYGGNVTVSLTGLSRISLTGTTGVGIFAVSEVYSVADTPKDSTVQSGTVSVTIGQGSAITTGTTGSLFSIGVLAIGAGSDLFLSPFTSQQVNGHGVGNAGAVEIVNVGTVSTQGKLSAGLVALSIGGAGIVTSNSGTSPDSALGNSGGADTNGSGDAVTVTNDGVVTTLGANAYGIVALSTGGGGIINNDIAVIADANGVATGGLVIGNDSSSSSSSHASAGGAITVTNSGTVFTGDGTGTGVASMGIVAQSIGGAGGNAGGDQAAWFVGDKGGQGGNGGATSVTLGVNSLLTTSDENSIGVLVQSIGGGGGNGANAKGLFVAVGGKGGAGGDGGAVIVDVYGSLGTQDDYSAGVIAQSIGGGGGHGGTATAIGVGAAFGLGGNGGSGGGGGAVDGVVGAEGMISTVGNNSTALHLQSVGGGGGTGGASIVKSVGVGTGEDVTLDFNMAVGGSGGNGGLGGAVSGTNAGVISTGVAVSGSSNGAPNMDGADSYGMMAQSIGGGGGQGGLASAKSLALNLSGSNGGTTNPDDPAEAEIDPGPVSGTTSLVISIGANVSDSGSGGSGNDGGTVSLDNLGTVTTWGDGSIAMIAQSVGGGGGSGGDSTATSALSAATGQALGISVNLGGGGGNGGSGGSVTMANSGAGAVIQTYGQNATGMMGQSIGGGGGNAAIGNSGTANLHTPVTGSNSANTVAIAFQLGGSGGKGGNAGFVEMENDGLISTAGSGAQGVLAQAIGGGGGNASGGGTDGSNNKFTIDLSLGASGGDGGSASGTNSLGNSVTVTNSGTIATLGGDAVGIVAQSIGGGGGTGGSADAQASIGAVGSITNLLFSSTSYQASLTLGAAVGGDGGGGGHSGSVVVNQDGLLSTEGFQSYGILAQSISGGGGKGGTATAAANPGLVDVYDKTIQFGALIAVGGKGGDSHDGGAVTVNVAGVTSTGGYGAHAVVAQSIAGGGGLGADGTADVSSSLGLGASVGNVSGTMGDGGDVLISQTASIATAGSDASGIVAQSISGGGGMASTGQDRHLLEPSGSFGVLPVHLDFSLGINLHSNDQANGGTVTINSGTATQAAPPQVTTLGDFSHGMLAQTIGAGGGKASAIFGTDSPSYADFSGTISQIVSGSAWTSGKGITLGAADGHGQGGTVNINLVNTAITTGLSGSTGYGAYGVLAQSIGGGGGLATVDTAAANGLVFLGGTSSASGVGGHGGVVNFSGGGSVTTHGDAAHGVVLQSIGGGGGVALIGSSRSFSDTAPADQQVDMTLGSHNSFGHGSTVSSTASVSIQTTGDQAFGLVAQSIGGGGGIATSQQEGAAALGMQASGTDSYDGGNVSVSGNSLIVTSGIGSHGVVAQSIGGGGGIANPAASDALTTTPAVTNSGTALGYGGAVDVNISGTVQTSGAGAYGIIAQSISGGGGLSGNFAGSTGGVHSTGSVGSGIAGDVTVELSGPDSLVSASGNNATAIFAQNSTAGSHGTGSVSLTIGGAVTGGSGANAYGIWVDGGNSQNEITILQGGVVSAGSKAAINYTGSGNVSVTNEGVVMGSVSLSDGSGFIGSFTNQASGTFFAEGTINAYVSDDGVLIVGVDSSEAASVTFGGGYDQNLNGSSDAVIKMQIFSAAEYDQIFFGPIGDAVFFGSLEVEFAASVQPEVGTIFSLINFSDAIDPDVFYDFSSASVVNAGEGVEWEFYVGAENNYYLQITAVPEPGAIVLTLFGAGCLMLWRVWRRGSSGSGISPKM